MNVQFVKVGKCKIAYLEKNKAASKTIFFIPGNSVSKRIWRKQLESERLSDYRIIVIDLPAHGDSDAFDTSAYSLQGLAEILFNVIVELADHKPYIIAGISLGTNIIAEMLAFEINPMGLVLAGPCIFGAGVKAENIVKHGTHVGVVFEDSLEDNDILNYASETFLSRDDEDLKYFFEDFKKVQPPFRSALGKSVSEGNFKDEIALIKEKNIHSLVVFGKDEKIIDCNYLDEAELPLYNKLIYKIDGASHLVNIDQPEQFNQLLYDFAKDAFK